jgi:hypothetical protein
MWRVVTVLGELRRCDAPPSGHSPATYA